MHGMNNIKIRGLC